jgi:hypothetical protein
MSNKITSTKKGWRNLIGERFDKLVVEKRGEDYIYPSSKRHEPRWICKCDCGNKITVIHHNLLNGHVHCCKECKSNKLKDITGERFGKLTVIKRGEDFIGPAGRETQWVCKCDCGNTTIVRGHALRNGHTRSCGCLIVDSSTKHGLYNTKIYGKYNKMKHRCFNSNNKHYKRYGGRGITICDEWLGENGFINFYNWAMANGYSDDLTIDRINNDGNYEPSNCRWTTQEVQANNTSNNVIIKYNNEEHTISEWAKIYNIEYYNLYNRIINLGWSIDKALNTPINDYIVKIKDPYTGKERFLSDIAIEHGINPKLVYDRVVRGGWSIDKALNTPINNPIRYITFNGTILTTNEWEYILGLSNGCLIDRLNSGMTAEEALTTGFRNGIYFTNEETGKPIPQNEVD